MRGSGISVVKGTEKGAIRKTSTGKGESSSASDGKYRASKETERRVEAELKVKKKDEAWLAEKKERQEGFERQRINHEEMLRNSGHKDASAWHAKNFPLFHGREEEEEVDNIRETRFETTEDYGPLQPLPPHPATPSITASLDAEWTGVSTSEGEEKEEEEKKEKEGKKIKGRPSKKSSKFSYTKIFEAMRALERKLEKEKKKNKRQKKDMTPESDSILNRRSSESESNTIKDYSDGEADAILASPPSKNVARPKDGPPMDTE